LTFEKIRHLMDTLKRKEESEEITYYKKYLPYLFILPAIVWFFTIRVASLAYNLWLSFHSWRLIGEPKFVGLRNYQELFTDKVFLITLKNTALFAFGYVTLSVLLGLAIALALDRMVRWVRVTLQTLYFIPVVTATVVVAIVWTWIYDPVLGLLNWFLLDVIGLRQFGLRPIRWLGDPDIVLFSLILLTVWKNVGYNVLIFLAGLQAIPQEYYEAAAIDGAGTFTVIRKITLPLLKFTTAFVLVIQTMNGFQVFDQVYATTMGGPGNASMVLVLLIYLTAFVGEKSMGKAAAMSWILLLTVLILVILQLRALKQI